MSADGERRRRRDQWQAAGAGYIPTSSPPRPSGPAPVIGGKLQTEPFLPPGSSYSRVGGFSAPGICAVPCPAHSAGEGAILTLLTSPCSLRRLTGAGGVLQSSREARRSPSSHPASVSNGQQRPGRLRAVSGRGNVWGDAGSRGPRKGSIAGKAENPGRDGPPHLRSCQSCVCH